MLKVGQEYEVSRVVAYEDTAASVASGTLEVFGTPVMLAMMEEAAFTLVQKELEEGESTVGVEISSTHLKATAIGQKVRALAVLTKIEGRFFTFDVKAYEGDVLIGEGTHKRCIINIEKFMNKLSKR